ncbi:hypothetical protein Csa_009745 [Cucumis sativus]|uniref:Uncharacterized protein n=1 Tax=Cucumis sativus TaxID=3659 RepID=A0A0A0L6J5_CUCSA|nr:hypothetical protein Csa_009745 [Cucumis sativus]
MRFFVVHFIRHNLRFLTKPKTRSTQYPQTLPSDTTAANRIPFTLPPPPPPPPPTAPNFSGALTRGFEFQC